MKTYHRDRTDEELARSKRGKRSKAKGSRGETITAGKLREALADLIGPGKLEITQRNQGKWTGRWRPEIGIHPWGNYHDHIIHIENKREEGGSILGAFRQAVRDCAPGARPIAICKRSREPEIVVFGHDVDGVSRLGRIWIEYGKQLRSALLRATRYANPDIPIGAKSCYPDPDIYVMWLSDYLPYLRKCLEDYLEGCRSVSCHM